MRIQGGADVLGTKFPPAMIERCKNELLQSNIWDRLLHIAQKGPQLQEWKILSKPENSPQVEIIPVDDNAFKQNMWNAILGDETVLKDFIRQTGWDPEQTKLLYGNNGTNGVQSAKLFLCKEPYYISIHIDDMKKATRFRVKVYEDRIKWQEFFAQPILSKFEDHRQSLLLSSFQ
jgi:hypothetical protein